MYQHFLITRFNLYFDVFRFDKRRVATLTDEWLRERFTLFETVCLPSVMAQTNQNFIYIVLFRKKTPVDYMKRIESYSSLIKNFQAVFIDDNQNYLDILISHIRQQISSNIKFVITTRMDNDDAIHEKYIDNIQCEAKRVGHNSFINFNKGYLYDINKHLLVHSLQVSNPFISRVEEVKYSIETIWKMQLHIIISLGRTKSIDSEPMWLQVVHSGNILNQLTGEKYVYYKKALESFNLKANGNISFLNTVLYSIIAYVKTLINILICKVKVLIKFIIGCVYFFVAVSLILFSLCDLCKSI